jgi:hypothetical protein
VISLVPWCWVAAPARWTVWSPGAQLDLVRVVDAPGVTHLTYRVLK